MSAIKSGSEAFISGCPLYPRKRTFVSARATSLQCHVRTFDGAIDTLRVLVTESAHRVTGVAAFILLADIGDQRFWALHLNFEGGDQRVFRVNDNVSRFPL
jgi:hypothetical protein